MTGVTTRLLVLAGGLCAAVLTAAAALAAPGDPKVDIKPADQKRATTIIAKKAELKGPGWQGAPTDFGRANPKCVIKHYGLGKLTANARVGTEYTRDVDMGTFLVDSDAYVFRTPAEAAFATSRVSDLGYGRCSRTARGRGAERVGRDQQDRAVRDEGARAARQGLPDRRHRDHRRPDVAPHGARPGLPARSHAVVAERAHARQGLV